MNSTLKKICIGVIGAVILAVAFYFFYWTKTPTYSVGLIKEAYETHDVVKFEKHVDLDSVLNHFFDDAIVAEGQITGQNLTPNPFAAGFIQMLKPTIVDAMKTGIMNAVKGEKGDNQSAQSSTNEQINKTIESRFDTKDVAFRDISVLDKENNIATVALKFHSDKADKDYEIHAKMYKLDDGTWCLKEFSNATELLVQMSQDGLYHAK